MAVCLTTPLRSSSPAHGAKARNKGSRPTPELEPKGDLLPVSISRDRCESQDDTEVDGDLSLQDRNETPCHPSLRVEARPGRGGRPVVMVRFPEEASRGVRRVGTRLDAERRRDLLGAWRPESP